MGVGRLTGALIVGAAAMAVACPPAGAQFRGSNGRVALAWLDSDRGAHEEAAWEIVSVPWRTGAATGHRVVSCTMVDGCPWQFSSPAYSPSGKQIVYTETALNPPNPSSTGISQLTLAGADGGSPTAITHGALNSYDASFLPSGAGLVFVQSQQPASDTGVDPEGSLVTSENTGGNLSPLGSLRGSDPRFSPDGKHLLFTHHGAIWIADSRGGHPRKLIAHATKGDFSPNSHSVLYLSGAPLTGAHRLYVARLDGSHPRLITGHLPHRGSGPIAEVDQAVFSPDGSQIAFSTTDPVEGNPEILRVPSAGGQIRPLWYAAALDAGGMNLGIAWQPR